MQPTPSKFKTDQDLCGSRLSSLVCRGHCLITTLLQSANEIPSVFMEGYVIDEFSSSYNFHHHSTSSSSSPTSSSSSYGISLASSFLRSTVVRSIFGNGNHHHRDSIHTLTKVRSQAPSFCKSNTFHNTPFTSTSAASSSSSSAAAASFDSSEKNKFKSILIDFAYLSNPLQFEKGGVSGGYKTNNSSEKGNMKNALQSNNSNNHIDTTARTISGTDTIISSSSAAAEQEQLEREFATLYKSTLYKFYNLFTDIYQYYTEINTLFNDLDNGHFVEHTLRSLLLESVHSRQLICEVLYLYGSLLVLMDIYIPGEIRERLIIAHYRYCERDVGRGGGESCSNFENICKLCERTDYSVESINSNNSSNNINISSTSTQIQPELICRLPLSSTIIKTIIECIITVDLYPDQTYAFPSYDHRSSKLGHQASMVVILLFFNPQIMINNESIMRQIVERFFHDTWVVPLYNGAILDLSIEWSSVRFPAANNALKHVIQRSNIQRLNYENMKQIISCMEEVKLYLLPNNNNMLMSSSPKALLDIGEDVLDSLRKSNVVLRWQILHRAILTDENHGNSSDSMDTSSSTLKAMIVDEHDILSFILLISQLEVQLKEAYSALLQNKDEIWSQCRNSSVETMYRLSKHFYGSNKDLIIVEKNEDLGQWFDQMKNEIDALDCIDNDKIGSEIQLCIEALDDIKKLDVIDSDNQVMEMIHHTKKNLVHMAKIMTVKANVCSMIDAISDFSYAREIMECFLPLLHAQSMKNPNSVTLLRAFFLKAGRLNSRFQELAANPYNHLDHVSKYHERAILSFVKETLDVIPITIFSTLAHIADEKSLAQIPAKIEADRLGDYLHFENRYKLAKVTFELSVLTKGIFAMEKTLIGDLEIKPKSILEEGLRKELVCQYSSALHSALQFQIPIERTKQSLTQHKNACINIFMNLGNRIDGFQRSMIWLQDFLEIDGLRIFMNETFRVIRENVSRELKNLTQRSDNSCNELDGDDEGIPIPFFARSSNDSSSATFVGRTMNALVHLTDPKHTIFSNHLYGWYFASGESVCGMKTINCLRNTIGVNGLAGIDKLLSCKVRNQLLRFVKFYSNTESYRVILEQFRDSIFPEWKCPNGMESYEAALRRTIKLMLPLTKLFCRIGQLQLLRRLIKTELRLAVNHKVLVSCNIRSSDLLNDITNHSGSNDIDQLASVSDDLLTTGLTNPMSDVFLRTNSLEGLSSLLTLYVVDTMRNINYDSDLGALVGKEVESIDGWAVVAGVATVLKQFNASYTSSLFSLIGQYLFCSVESHLQQARIEELPRVTKETRNIIIFMKQLSSIANLDAAMLHQCIPQYLIEMIATQN